MGTYLLYAATLVLILSLHTATFLRQISFFFSLQMVSVVLQFLSYWQEMLPQHVISGVHNDRLCTRWKDITVVYVFRRFVRQFSVQRILAYEIGFLTNTSSLSKVCVMLGQCRRWWANARQTSDKRAMFAELIPPSSINKQYLWQQNFSPVLNPYIVKHLSATYIQHHPPYTTQ